MPTLDEEDAAAGQPHSDAIIRNLREVCESIKVKVGALEKADDAIVGFRAGADVAKIIHYGQFKVFATCIC